MPVEDLLNQDSTAVLCEDSHINLVLEYIPTEDNETKYIEWYSSDFSITPSLTPKFNVDYRPYVRFKFLIFFKNPKKFSFK